MGMRLIHFLSRESNRTGRKILVAGLIAGAFNGLLVVVINEASQNYGELNFRYMLIFILSVLILALTRHYTLHQTSTIARSALTKTNLRIADKIRRSHLATFERIGKPKILTTLSEGTEVVFEACRRIANGAVAAIMLIFSSAYMAWLSMTALWLELAVIACGVAVYVFNQRTIDQELRASAKMENEFVASLNHLLEGFKEVKMNRAKSDDLFCNHLKAISASVQELKVRTEGRFISNIIYTQVFMMIMIAAVIFILPQMRSSSPQLIMSLVAVLLFVVGPLGAVVEAIPVISVANIALEKLEALEEVFDRSDDTRESQPTGPLQAKTTFSTITLKKVSFAYEKTNNEPTFSVGPIDLEVKRGEVLFFVGGNGSGKTTLVKLLAGLYYPQRGAILLDDVPVNMTNYEAYRNFFSIILTDFHLFDRLYGLREVDEARLSRLLGAMDLSEKLAYRDGKFSELNLSTGQRKRLALVIALMEDKPIYLFDEVAADQDPGFRRHFYEEVLAELKGQGKTIIASTHDDRYFHVADRVLKLDFGAVVEEKVN